MKKNEFLLEKSSHGLLVNAFCLTAKVKKNPKKREDVSPNSVGDSDPWQNKLPRGFVQA